MARPSKYNPKYHIPWVEGLVRRGATAKEVADELEVSVSTLYKWADEDDAFSEALKGNRDIVDMQVEKSLLQRAMGYKASEKKTIVQSGNNGEQKPVRIEIIEKEIPPDTTACIFWLKNRNPDLWRDKREYDVEGKMNVEDDALTKSLEELAGGLKSDAL